MSHTMNAEEEAKLRRIEEHKSKAEVKARTGFHVTSGRKPEASFNSFDTLEQDHSSKASGGGSSKASGGGSSKASGGGSSKAEVPCSTPTLQLPTFSLHLSVVYACLSHTQSTNQYLRNQQLKTTSP